jgi:hypothetical protein
MLELDYALENAEHVTPAVGDPNLMSLMRPTR